MKIGKVNPTKKGWHSDFYLGHFTYTSINLLEFMDAVHARQESRSIYNQHFWKYFLKYLLESIFPMISLCEVVVSVI